MTKNNIDIIIGRLDRIENKIDSIGTELNKNINTTCIQGEQIMSLDREIEEIKQSDIPLSSKMSSMKIKLWVSGGIIGLLTSIGFSLFGLLK